MYRRRNAERLVILANITRLVLQLQNLVLTAVLLQTPAVFVHHANPLRPVHTRHMSAALTDAQLIVLAARLAKPANRLLPKKQTHLQPRLILGSMSEKQAQLRRSAMKTTDKSGKSAKPGIIA